MAFHEKTGKWFNDCVKREKRLHNKGSLKQEQSVKREQGKHSSAHYFHCNYCIKVFYEAKFLVKHILRRHSDKLIDLHKQIISTAKNEKVIYETSDLFEFLKAEFSYLKVETDYIRRAFTDYMQENKDAVAEGIDYKQSDNKVPNMDSPSISAQSDSLKYKQTEFSPNQASDTDFQNLQAQVDKLFQMFRETVLSKEDIKETLVLNEERIYNTIKNEILLEVQNIFSNYQKTNKDEYEANYVKLKIEIDNLEKVVNLNAKKIESPECFLEFQKKFELNIQNFLTGRSLFNSNSKRNVTDKSKNSNNEHKSKKKMKSIYTLQPDLNKRDLSTNSKDYDSNTSMNQKRKQKLFNSEINQESCLFSSESNQLKMKEQEKLHEFNSLVDNSENFTEKHLKKVKLVVEEKLKSLNIDPSREMLSNVEFEKKIRLINSEKMFLDKKYENFSQIRDELDFHVDKIVNSKMGKKVPKKLHFSDSPKFPSDSIDSNSSVKMQGGVSDLYAKGDSSLLKKFDVEHVSPIQEDEDDSENSYRDYSHKFSAQEHNSYESLKRYIPVSPVNYVIKNTSKISKDSNVISESSINTFTAKKQESGGFIVSDLNAQGDSPFFKKNAAEYLSTIQENDEDNPKESDTNYSHKFSAEKQNNYESFRKCLPVNSLGYMMENTAKMSKDSLLPKSVEELSDLSSLESDNFEDE